MRRRWRFARGRNLPAGDRRAQGLGDVADSSRPGRRSSRSRCVRAHNLLADRALDYKAARLSGSARRSHACAAHVASGSFSLTAERSPSARRLRLGAPPAFQKSPHLDRLRGAELVAAQRAGVEGPRGYAAHEDGGLLPLDRHFRANGMACTAPGCFGTGETCPLAQGLKKFDASGPHQSVHSIFPAGAAESPNSRSGIRTGKSCCS